MLQNTNDQRLKKIPATIVTGFLGAGKTSLIQNLLATAHGKKIALIINEFGDLGVDKELIMGCKIEGEGESKIIIDGVDSLKETTHRVVMDRIELGTFIIAGAITNSDIKLTGGNTALLENFISKLHEVGVEIHQSKDYLQVKRTNGSSIKCTNILTEPFPGFPTDLQAQMMALLSIANGVSKIEEQIFENRFMHVPELNRMGAKIEIEGRTAIISGVHELRGAPVKATDLRASVSLVLAGLVANGHTIIDKIHHIDRGYEDIIQKLETCGAAIKRI